MKISVITSGAAQKDLLRIKAIHSDIVTGMANQQIKSDNYRQQKAVEMQNRTTMENEMKKEQMIANTAAQKNALDFSMKQSELDVRRAALATNP